jgi:8-oxo-dGTP pyrophosphatase MutT (NUDIX family)
VTIPKSQYAALPYRRRAHSLVEILLVTSRDTGRWVIPKGWPIPGLAAHNSAAREAMEEGGVLGQVGDHAIGIYHYNKRLADGFRVRCAVEVFPLKVEQQLGSWPEQAQRDTRWFSVADAARAVQEPDLSAIIRSLAMSLV